MEHTVTWRWSNFVFTLPLHACPSECFILSFFWQPVIDSSLLQSSIIKLWHVSTRLDSLQNCPPTWSDKVTFADQHHTPPLRLLQGWQPLFYSTFTSPPLCDVHTFHPISNTDTEKRLLSLPSSTDQSSSVKWGSKQRPKETSASDRRDLRTHETSFRQTSTDQSSVWLLGQTSGINIPWLWEFAMDLLRLVVILFSSTLMYLQH